MNYPPLYAAGTKAGGVAVNGLNRTIDWRRIRGLAGASVATAAMTLLILLHFDLRSGPMDHFFSVALGAALVLTALATIFRPHITAWFDRRVGEPRPSAAAIRTMTTGAGLAVPVSLTSIGAGALGVTALVLLYPRLPIATDSRLRHRACRAVDARRRHGPPAAFIDRSPRAGSARLGSLPGIFVGSQLPVRVPDTILRLPLSAILVIEGGNLML